MPTPGEVLSPVTDHCWKPFGRFVRHDVFRSSDAGALPYGKHEQLRAYGFLKDYPPPPITATKAPPTVTESDDHLSARMGLEAVVQRFASERSIERGPVRAALEADAEAFELTATNWLRVEGVDVAVEKP